MGETQGLPCLMLSAVRSFENFEKNAMAPHRCIIAHFYKVVVQCKKSIDEISACNCVAKHF